MRPLDGGAPKKYQAPSGSTEVAIAGIFAKLLGIDQVGAEDDFFELGGHSLLATQAVAQARALFEVPLPVHALFLSPTVSGLAAAVEELRVTADGDDIGALLHEINQLSDEEAEALLVQELGRDQLP